MLKLPSGKASISVGEVVDLSSRRKKYASMPHLQIVRWEYDRVASAARKDTPQLLKTIASVASESRLVTSPFGGKSLLVDGVAHDVSLGVLTCTATNRWPLELRVSNNTTLPSIKLLGTTARRAVELAALQALSFASVAHKTGAIDHRSKRDSPLWEGTGNHNWPIHLTDAHRFAAGVVLGASALVDSDQTFAVSLEPLALRREVRVPPHVVALSDPMGHEELNLFAQATQ